MANQQYQEALHKCLEGLDRFQGGEALLSPQLILHFQMLLGILERNLETAFGGQWEKRIPKISNPGIHCSFCYKRQEEVKKIIAGPYS